MPEFTQLSGDASRMVGAWTGFYRKLWDQSLGVATGRAGWTPDGTAGKFLEMSERILDDMANLQSECQQLIFSSMRLGAGTLPAFWTEWLQQTEEAATQWSRAQQRVVKYWIEAVREQRPFLWGRVMDPTKGAMGAWQDAADNAWEVWSEWFKVSSLAMKPWQKAAREVAETVEQSAEPGSGAVADVARVTPRREAGAGNLQRKRA
jgi:hypothetical protein